jgi:hypothetical protein
MWRIYSGDRCSVRVKVKLNTLFRQLALEAMDVPFIGRVWYLRPDQLLEWTRKVVQATKKPSLELLAKGFW